jgi:GDP-4-dehydro-6-deoxy-D-mannose reductase
MTTVLLTGAAGMLGAAVLAKFESCGTADVWTTDLRPLDREHHVVADLEDPAASAALAGMGHEVVLHLAGVTAGDVGLLVRSNVLATTNLLGSLAAGTRVVVAGSAAEYGTSDGERIAENAPLQPVSRYGWTKACQTEVASAIAQRRDLALAVARPFNIVGPSLPKSTAFGNIKEQITATSPGTTAILRTGRLDITRDLVPIDFVADVMTEMTVDAATEGVYNICTGQGLVLQDVVAQMARLRGVDLDQSVDSALASLPAAERIVGDPSKVAERYGLVSTPTASDVANVILGESVRDRDGELPSRRSPTQASRDQ